MNRYEEYKETNIGWLGKIPSTWTISRVGKFFTERSEKVDDVTYPPLSVTMSGIVDQLLDVAKSDDGGNRKLVRKNDFVINSRSDRKGSSGISPRDGSVSLINIVLEPKGIDPLYSEYLFKSYLFKEEFFRNGKGIHWDLWSTRWDQFKNINIPIPTLNEQQLISCFIDKKIKKIDNLIEKNKKKIEILKEEKNSIINQSVTKGIVPNIKLKDSGYEWIGKIPFNWEVYRLKNICTITNGVAFSSNDFSLDSEIPVIRIGDVNNPLRLNECVKLPSTYLIRYKDFIISKNDILVGLTGGTIGKSCIYDSETLSFLNQRVCSLKSKNEVDQFFLYNFVKSFIFKHQIDINCYGGGQPNIGNENLLNFIFIKPPKHEQIKISTFIKEKSFKFDQLISIENRRLQLLSEYRTSLISSSVTGKIKITEEMI